jgi:hypothetical protein
VTYLRRPNQVSVLDVHARPASGLDAVSDYFETDTLSNWILFDPGSLASSSYLGPGLGISHTMSHSAGNSYRYSGRMKAIPNTEFAFAASVAVAGTLANYRGCWLGSCFGHHRR